MAPFVYKDCVHCGGSGVQYVKPHLLFNMTQTPHEPCSYCLGRGWEDILKQETTMAKDIVHEHKSHSFGSPIPVGHGQYPPDVNPPKEAVAHPSHYNGGRIEVIDAIEDWRMGFNDGNVIKYVARHRMKLSPKEDLEKAFWYLTRELMSHHGVTEIRLVEMVRGCVKDRPGTK